MNLFWWSWILRCLVQINPFVDGLTLVIHGLFGGSERGLTGHQHVHFCVLCSPKILMGLSLRSQVARLLRSSKVSLGAKHSWLFGVGPTEHGIYASGLVEISIMRLNFVSFKSRGELVTSTHGHTLLIISSSEISHLGSITLHHLLLGSEHELVFISVVINDQWWLVIWFLQLICRLIKSIRDIQTFLSASLSELVSVIIGKRHFHMLGSGVLSVCRSLSFNFFFAMRDGLTLGFYDLLARKRSSLISLLHLWDLREDRLIHGLSFGTT